MNVWRIVWKWHFPEGPLSIVARSIFKLNVAPFLGATTERKTTATTPLCDGKECCRYGVTLKSVVEVCTTGGSEASTTIVE